MNAPPPRSPPVSGRSASRPPRFRRRGAYRMAAPRWRRAAGAVCAALAVGGLLLALRPAAAPSTEVLVAARDLDALAPLSGGDVDVRRLPRDLVPDGALPARSPPEGASLSGPMRAGEVFTSARVADPPAAGFGAGLVAAPVRVADPETVALLRPGSRVDVISAVVDPVAAELGTAGSATAEVVAADRPVVTVPAADPASGGQGALVVIAATGAEARALAIGALDGRLSVTIRG